jgi:hypothetical protein
MQLGQQTNLMKENGGFFFTVGLASRYLQQLADNMCVGTYSAARAYARRRRLHLGL